MMRTKRHLAFSVLAMLLLALAPAWSSVTRAASAAPEQTGHVEGDRHADTAHAGDHGDPSPIATPQQGVITGVMAIIVFVAVFALLYAMVWPKIAGGLDERASKIRDEIASAEAARKQAKMALDEYEKSLADARAEANKMLEETKAKQGALAAELRAKADVELGQMRERAMRDIDAAKKAALNEIYTESVNLATMMAGKILGREVSSSDQGRLVEESLAELATSRG